ncbi:DUF814 domain-containing protein [bacterium]|nr:DUF814 domain-containing protein [bacterium]
MYEFLSQIIGAKIHRGYRFPFGGWLEIRHRYRGKFGVFFYRTEGKAGIILSPMLPKVNIGWCSAAEGFVIDDIFVDRNTVFFRLKSHERRRFLIFELFGGGDVIVADENWKILWSDRKRERTSAGKIFKIAEDKIFADNLSFGGKNIENAEREIAIKIAEGGKTFKNLWKKLLSKDVFKKINSENSSILRALKALRSDYERLGDPQKLRRKAEVILANIFKISENRKDDKVRVIDPYTDREMEISIDKNCSPQEYAEKLFRRAKRAERGRREIVRRYRELLRKKRKLSLMKDFKDIDKLAAEFSIDKFSILGEPIPSLKKSKPIVNLAGIKRFVSSDGFVILVGRSAEANNRLTFKIAAKDDIWLHAEGTKGSHTIIKLAGNKQVPRRTLEEAASLAAFFSDAKHSSLVPVIYTRRRYVHPVKKKLGQVHIDRYEVIMVKPRVIS